MPMKLQVRVYPLLAWDRHINVDRLNRLMGSQYLHFIFNMVNYQLLPTGFQLYHHIFFGVFNKNGWFTVNI